MAAPEPKPFPTVDASVARSTPDSKHFNTLIARAEKIRFVDCDGNSIAKEERYIITQGKRKDDGNLDDEGCAMLRTVDPGEPFRVVIPGRVCFIQQGLIICNTEKDEVEYGGTRVDWTRAAVADDSAAQSDFWKFYDDILKEEKKIYAKRPDLQTVMTFWQHEHVTRRDVAIRPTFLNMKEKEKRPTFLALPLRIRTGPMVRYTDHTKSCIWVETETPALVRVRYQKKGGGDVAKSADKAHGATVRVGGRHFALAEVPAGAADKVFEYTLELASPPSEGKIPTEPATIDAFWNKDVFPDVYPDKLRKALDEQLDVCKYSSKPLAFKTLKKRYDKLNYMYGSCRKHPYDLEHKDHEKENTDWLDEYASKLGDDRSGYPEFCFFGGDQIYGDDLGEEARQQVSRERFGARPPGPLKDTTGYETLGPGAFAGRFAHRFHDVQKVLQSHAMMKSKALVVAGQAMSVLRQVLELFQKNKGKAYSAWSRHDQVELVTIIFELRKLDGVKREYNTDYFKPEKQPMEHKLSVCNDVLWRIPNVEKELPVVEETALWTRDGAPYPAAGDTKGVHACDFAEYAYLYEVAWAKAGWKEDGKARKDTSIRKLLANVPIYLAFDDHEVTDDWNFGSKWISYLATDRDPWQHWPNTMSDALAAYLVYQHWGNIDPVKWKSDPRASILDEARAEGKDALAELRAAFRPAITQITTPGAGGHHQQFEWFYQLPIESPVFLVPDMRTRKMIPISHEGQESRDHEGHMMDPEQLEWIERELMNARGPAAFVAAATPYLFPRYTTFAMKHFAGLMVLLGSIESGGGILGGTGGVGKAVGALIGLTTFLNTFNFFEETKADEGSGLGGFLEGTGERFGRLGAESELNDRGRRARDFEHMNLDETWDDVREMFVRLGKGNPRLKSVVFFSGDIHHTFGMLANVGNNPLSAAPGELTWTNQKYPQLLQLISSGFKQQVGPAGCSVLDLGIVFFPRDHFFRGMSIRCGGFPGMKEFVKDDLLGQTVLFAQNTVATVDARFETSGTYVDLTQTNETSLHGHDIKKDHERKAKKVSLKYTTSDATDFISEYWVNPKLAWVGDMVRAVEIALWMKDLVTAGEKRVQLAKAIMDRLGLPEVSEKELKEIIDVVKDPSIQALSRGALAKVYMKVGRNTEALEQSRAALEFLEAPGGTARGALQEAHSAHAQALESNGMAAEAAQFRMANPTTTIEPVAGIPSAGEVGGRGVGELGRAAVIPGTGGAAIPGAGGAAIPAAGAAMPAGGAAAPSIPTGVAAAKPGKTALPDMPKADAASPLDSLRGKLDDAKKSDDPRTRTPKKTP